VSGSIKIAKAQYRGDPGLFGFLGDAIGKVAGVVGKVMPGPIGMVASGVSSLLNKPKSPAVAVNVASNGKPLNPSLFPVTRMALPQLPMQQPDSVVQRGITIPGLFQGPTTTTHYSPAAPAGAHPGQGCGSGYHTNKTGYWTRQGFVPAGSKCVRNRKRNPLNPRAASRAMSRLSSAKKAAKFLGSISIRERGCGCK
jgi:hypothetical protein